MSPRHCVRMHPCGTVVGEHLSLPETHQWVQHYRSMFPSWGLMIDGVFCHCGRFTAPQIHILETHYLITPHLFNTELFQNSQVRASC